MDKTVKREGVERGQRRGSAGVEQGPLLSFLYLSQMAHWTSLWHHRSCIG
jgi:hypothetical protein